MIFVLFNTRIGISVRFSISIFVTDDRRSFAAVSSENLSIIGALKKSLGRHAAAIGTVASGNESGNSPRTQNQQIQVYDHS